MKGVPQMFPRGNAKENDRGKPQIPKEPQTMLLASNFAHFETLFFAL